MKRETNLRVLYVEDNEDSCELVAMILSFANIDVAHTGSVDSAWSLAKCESYDLFLLDGKVRNVRTLGLCGRLHELCPDTPILFYTGLAGKKDIQDGLNAGAQNYLVKPYWGDLAETVINTVNDGAARRKLLLNAGQVPAPQQLNAGA